MGYSQISIVIPCSDFAEASAQRSMIWTAAQATPMQVAAGREQRTPIVRKLVTLRIARVAPFLAVNLLLPLSNAAAEYQLHAGDVIELVIAGVPELKQRSAVGISGELSLPLVGQVEAAGLTIAELTSKVGSLLGRKVYQQRTLDGREVSHVFSNEEIVLSVVEYRPIYVAGDVSKPGEHAFRPGMRARQAIAVAGGYDVMRFRMNNPILKSADLRAEYESLWTEFAREQVRSERLRNELGEEPSPTPSASKAPVPLDLLNRFRTSEAEQSDIRGSDLKRQRSHLQQAIKTVEAQLAIVSEKKVKDQEGVKSDAQDYERIRDLFQRGMTPNVRLTEARRAVLLSSTQYLQTIVEGTNFERQRADYVRQFERIDNQRRLEILGQLQDIDLRLAQINARLRSVGEKLLYTTTLQSQLVRGKGGHPHIVVHRDGETRVADEHSPLLPGDVVEVVLQADDYASGFSRTAKP